ncbi:MAG TPA: DUF2442 domain-containing protein [Candidatus Baltobacteraceae bacterium]|nr:DUF2442 domain-containing protein [Candidatus Baltobacteraceae bacterium]
MKKQAHILTTDAEIEAAIAQANLLEEYRPKAASVEYRENFDTIAVTLASGVELVIPRRLLQGLEHATAAQLKDVQIVGAQSGLHWRQLNVDHYVPGLIEGIFGNKRWMSEIGKRGGATRSAAKTAAVRQNGRKGGRPPKKRTAA